MIQFDEHIFQRGWNHQLENGFFPSCHWLEIRFQVTPMTFINPNLTRPGGASSIVVPLLKPYDLRFPSNLSVILIPSTFWTNQCWIAYFRVTRKTFPLGLRMIVIKRNMMRSCFSSYANPQIFTLQVPMCFFKIPYINQTTQVQRSWSPFTHRHLYNWNVVTLEVTNASSCSCCPVYVSTPIRSQERESTLLTPQYLQWVLFAPKLSRFFGNISNIDFKLVGWQKDTKQQKTPKVPQAKRPSRLGLPARVRLELNGWT